MKRFLLAILFFISLPITAHAYLVTTGTPDESTAPFMVQGGSDWSALAWNFNLPTASVVTSIEGYFYDLPVFITPGSVSAALYSGTALDSFNLPIPDPTSQIFSGSFNIEGVEHADFLFGGWYGIQSLNLALGPGSYWIAFGNEVDTYQGGMPGVAPNPLSPSAFAQAGYNGGSFNGSQLITDAGVRIDGTVPEPATLLLLGLGLAGLAGVRRKLS